MSPDLVTSQKRWGFGWWGGQGAGKKERRRKRDTGYSRSEGHSSGLVGHQDQWGHQVLPGSHRLGQAALLPPLGQLGLGGGGELHGP